MQCLFGLEGSPGIGSHHNHTLIDLEDVFHAPDLSGLGVVDALCAASKYWTVGNGGIEHVRQPGIDAKPGFAIDLFRDIGAWQRLSENDEFPGFLEQDCFRNRQLGGDIDQLCIGHFLACGSMDNHPQPGLAVADRHLHARCASLQQYFPGDGAGLSECNPALANTGAAAGSLPAISRVQGGVFNGDGFPVQFQFLGDQHGHQGVGALSHFRFCNENGGCSRSCDDQPGIGRESCVGAAVRNLVVRTATPVHAQNQTAAKGCGAQFKESSSVRVKSFHDVSP